MGLKHKYAQANPAPPPTDPAGRCCRVCPV